MRKTGAAKRIVLWGLRCSFIVVATLTGCKQPETNSGAGGDSAPAGGQSGAPGVGKAKPYTGSDILLGEYGSLTGTTATFGTSTRDGIKLAVEEANKAGGVLGKQIRIQLENNAGSPEQATTVVKKLIKQDNVLAVLGEVASSRSLAAAPVCQAAGVPMISPTSTNPRVTQIGDYIFRTCFIDPFQGTVNARFARHHSKAKTAAVLTDVKNDYSVGLSEFFITEFKKLGGEIVAEESYKEGDTDFRAQLSNIKARKPDIIFIPGYYTEVGSIAKQARDLGLRQPLLGGDGWDSPKLTEIGGEAVQDCYFSTHYAPQSKDPRVVKFVADYKKRFNEVPNALAAVAYDAARIMFDAIKRAGSTDRAKIRDAIAATKKFPGVTGSITIDKDRNAVKPL
ncbi:MAG TPA: ABC transporter substrate-binding protein, partial [Abditibacteriaceae bacterium]|nr:ABC transporter substrate-binding protein [Abditibacteriaceae bacterium]